MPSVMLRLNTVSAVHERDLFDFIELARSKGVVVEKSCAICASPIKPEDAGAFRREGSRLLMVCERPMCLARWTE